MTFRLGLTGSIGMGKSTTAAMLADMGLPVWDADAAVHRLYAKGGAAVAAVAALAPSAASGGAIDRAALRAELAQKPDLLTQIQAVVHPLVAADRTAFLAAQTAEIVVLDIPLLFEIGADTLCDGVLVVTAAADVQKARVLHRGITEADFALLLARQMPDSEKQARARWVVQTNSLADVREKLLAILAEISAEQTNA